MIKSKTLKITRRRFMKGAAGTAAAVTAAPMIAKGLTRQAKADYKPGTIRLLGGASTLIPGDWTQFEKDTGLKMEFSLLKDDPGVFFNDVMVNDAGSRTTSFPCSPACKARWSKATGSFQSTRAAFPTGLASNRA